MIDFIAEGQYVADFDDLGQCLSPVLRNYYRSANWRKAALEASIGASKGVFSRALANGTDVQSKWLVGIAERYPQYSPEWLLAGTGEMLKSTVSREPVESYTSMGRRQQAGLAEAVAEALRQVIATQEKTILALEKQIAFLENELQNVNR